MREYSEPGISSQCLSNPLQTTSRSTGPSSRRHASRMMAQRTPTRLSISTTISASSTETSTRVVQASTPMLRTSPLIPTPSSFQPPYPPQLAKTSISTGLSSSISMSSTTMAHLGSISRLSRSTQTPQLSRQASPLKAGSSPVSPTALMDTYTQRRSILIIGWGIKTGNLSTVGRTGVPPQPM